MQTLEVLGDKEFQPSAVFLD